MGCRRGQPEAAIADLRPEPRPMDAARRRPPSAVQISLAGRQRHKLGSVAAACDAGACSRISSYPAYSAQGDTLPDAEYRFS